MCFPPCFWTRGSGRYVTLQNLWIYRKRVETYHLNLVLQDAIYIPINMSDSSVNAYLDSAKATVQSGIASLTGSNGDAQEAQQSRDKADFEHDASHTAAKVGPYTVTPSGAAKQSDDRTQGQWDQFVSYMPTTP